MPPSHRELRRRRRSCRDQRARAVPAVHHQQSRRPLKSTIVVLVQKTLTIIIVILALLLLASRVGAPTDAASTSTPPPSVVGDDPISFALRVMGLRTADREPREAHPQRELLVLGAGWPRTGTRSLKAALERLGYKVLHMEDSSPFHRAIVHGLTSEPKMRELLDAVLAAGFNATVDMPFHPMAIDLAKRYPNAKVILSVRDDADQWAASFDALQRAFAPSMVRPLSHLFDSSFARLTSLKFADFDWVLTPCDPAPWWSRLAPWLDCVETATLTREPRELYLEWNARVRREIPPERLLEFNVKQGWAPLASFLGRPIPSDPFPHVNEASQIRIVGVVLRAIALLWPALVLACVVTAARVADVVVRVAQGVLTRSVA